MKYIDQSTAMLFNSPLAPYVETYKKHFIQESYSPKQSKRTFTVLLIFLTG